MVVIDEKDIGKTREQVLLDLIYEATGERIPLDKVKFGKPREIDKRKDLEHDPNTFIPARIDPKYDARYAQQGDDGFLYRRRDLEKHSKGAVFNEIKPLFLPFKVSDILDQINACLPYPVGASDLIDHKYTTIEQVEAGVHLQAHPESLLWIRGTKIKVDSGYIDGTPLLAVTEIDGFHPWVPCEETAATA